MNNEEKTVAIFDNEKLSQLANLGISKVDPTDILPPQLRLVNKMGDLSTIIMPDGKSPRYGQFYHTGKVKAYDKLEVYFVFAAKKTFKTQEDPDLLQPKYVTIGCLADDMSLFGMEFKKSSFYAISPLLTAVKSQMRPMFSFKVELESKEITGKKGSWVIPTLRIVDNESDPVKLQKLQDIAMTFESKSDVVITEDGEFPF